MIKNKVAGGMSLLRASFTYSRCLFNPMSGDANQFIYLLMTLLLLG